MGLIEKGLLKIYGVLRNASFKRAVFNALNKKLCVIAAFPRAASRNLAGRICELNDKDIKYTDDVGLCPGIGHHFIDHNKLQIGLPIFRHALIYGHIPINDHNYQILNRYKKVYVMIPIRPLPDVMVSYRDFMKGGHGPLDWRAPNSGPEGCPGFLQLTPKRQMDYLLDYIAPWYLRFLSSWLSVREFFKPVFVSFESQTSQPAETLAAIFGHIEAGFDRDKLEGLQRSTKTYNKNIGVPGRGSELSHQHIQRLKALTAYHPMMSETGLERYLIEGKADQIRRGEDGILFI